MTSIKFRALTHNDHKLFFEALSEFGKDFQNIQQYMTQKGGKGGNKSGNDQVGGSKLNHQSNQSNQVQGQQSYHQFNNQQNLQQSFQLDAQEKKELEKKEDDKKRDQIRNFYNKLYSKLAQLVGKLDDRVEKVSQELYLLINYGEIWKKYGFKFNNKTKKLLEELVHQGSASLRFKSKNVRLRTPPCKALKKINRIGVDEESNLVTSRELPKDVIVEFHPSTNRDWLRVQSISQNPRVKARLSMQKRISSIIEFLQFKWNVSAEKPQLIVDSWLKMPQNNIQLEDQNQTSPAQVTSTNPNIGSSTSSSFNGSYNNVNNNLQATSKIYASPNLENMGRLRLRPSCQHELKKLNITRVVPDYHLDLSLDAYIKRLGIQEQKPDDNMKNSNSIPNDDMYAVSGNSSHSLGATSNNSRLPVSLVTPDASVILERSITSDQPSIAQARKQLNFLQTLAGSFEGCENSRTACEDTQDKSLPGLLSNDKNRVQPHNSTVVSFASDSNQARDINVDDKNCSNVVIPALFSEDAAIDPVIPNCHQKQLNLQSSQHNISSQSNSDCNKDKSVDFHIPTNVTLGDWFKSAEDDAGDNASDAFTCNLATNVIDKCENSIKINNVEENEPPKEENNDMKKNKTDQSQQNQIIEIKKMVEGFIIGDESSQMTIGELYLAFKCPEKIILEYKFENCRKSENLDISRDVNPTEDPCQDKSLIFKLLTAASLSLAHLERIKQEQQHKLHDQPSVKMTKRRKGQLDTGRNQSLAQAMTPHEVQTTNQRVEEALKRLQPTRLSVFRRAR